MMVKNNKELDQQNRVERKPSNQRETTTDRNVDGNSLESVQFSDPRMNHDFTTAENWAVFGVVGNVVLTSIKAAAGIIGNSSAMVADAMHSASDILASAVVFISLKIAKKPADESHPFGHGKAEAIATSIVGSLLLIAGFQIFRSGFISIRSTTIATPGIIALYAAILSIITKEIMYRLTYRVGKQINSPSTIANAMDHRSDAFSSIATLIGISGARLGVRVLDPLAGMIVSLFILKMGIDIICDGARQIMDSSAGADKIEQIRKIVLSVEGVKDTHDIRIRQSGAYYLVDLDICVDKDILLCEAHEIGDIARRIIHEQLEKIHEVRVHIDPH
jgi:cation diffusion facilitator family transporter